MLCKKRKPFITTKNKSPLFLIKLHKILDETKYSDIIHWDNDGKIIIISNEDDFKKKVLKKFFNHKNITSFIRQLNLYNFHKIKTNNKKESRYIHSEFNKDITKEQIKQIKKKKTNPNHIKINENISKKLDEIDDTEEKSKLENIEKMNDEHSKLKEYQNILEEGLLSNIANEKILNYLLDKSKEELDNKKFFEDGIKEINEQNKFITQKFDMYENKLKEQNQNFEKIKKLSLFLIKKLDEKIDDIFEKNKLKLKELKNCLENNNIIDIDIFYNDFDEINTIKTIEINNIYNTNSNIFNNNCGNSLNNTMLLNKSFNNLRNTFYNFNPINFFQSVNNNNLYNINNNHKNIGQEIVNIALSLRLKDSFGMLNIYDSSSFVHYCHQQIGINIPKTFEEIYRGGIEGDGSPGDIVCWDDYVGICDGEGNVILEYGTLSKYSIEDISKMIKKNTKGFRRYWK